MRAVANTTLNLGAVCTIDKQHFMLDGVALKDPDILTCIAILVYATHTVTNTLRKKDITFCQTDAVEALNQGCRNAVSNHPSSMSTLRKRYAQQKESSQKIARII